MRLAQLPLVLAIVDSAVGVAHVPPQFKGVTYIVNKIAKVTPAVSSALPSICGKYRHLRKEGVKIMGGSTVPQGRWPFAVALYGTNGTDEDVSAVSPHCTGSLISAHHVLTAAHCFGTCSPKGARGEPVFKALYAKVGKTSGGTGTVMRVSAVYMHDYHANNCSRNDVAIALLERYVDLNVKYEGHPIHGVICLPHTDEELELYFYAVGYGLDPHKVYGHGDLQEVLQYPAGDGWCNRLSDTRFDKYRDRYICTHEGKRMVCQGDSGGPLLQTTREGTAARQTATIVGVTHMGSYCHELKMLHDEMTPESMDYFTRTRTHGGSMFTDVRKYVGWICNATGICYSNSRMETTTSTSTSTKATTRRTSKRPVRRRTRPADRTVTVWPPTRRASSRPAMLITRRVMRTSRAKPTRRRSKATKSTAAAGGDCSTLGEPYASAKSLVEEITYKARHIRDYMRCKRTWQLHAIDWCRRQRQVYERDPRQYRRRNMKLYIRCTRRW